MILKTSIIAYLITFSSVLLMAQRPDDAHNKTQLAVELEQQMYKVLKTRSAIRNAKNSETINQAKKDIIKEDSILQNLTIQFLSNYGWPAKKLGKPVQKALFLSIQHSELTIMKKYFPVLKEAASNGLLLKSDLASIEDRILIREGKEQLYGTQYRRNEEKGIYEFFPISDPETVNKRRKKMKLIKIEKYAQKFGIAIPQGVG